MKKKRILIGCEYSAVEREEFAALGHYVMSCDILPTEVAGNHYQGDIFDILDDGWDMMIAHPPCTRLCNSGVRWLEERNLWADMRAGARFFKRLLDADIPQICIENPIPHKYAVAEIGRKYDQLVHPWQHGHGETKATCYWLKGLPHLVPSNVVSGRAGKIHAMGPSAERSKLRSLSYTGIAKAMAQQWG